MTQTPAVQIMDRLTIKVKKKPTWVLGKLYNLYLESAYPEKNAEPYPDKAAFKKGLEGESIALAYVNTKLVGFASFYTTHGFLHLINVDPSYQGLGIGQALMQEVIAVCQNSNYATHLKLLADIRNVSAHGFYERQGFGKLNVEPIEGKNYQCYHYEKEINTRLDHLVDYDYARKRTAISGAEEAKALGIELNEDYFAVIQQFNDGEYIQMSIEPDEAGERVMNTVIGADISNLKLHSAIQHVIELPTRTGYLDCFDHPALPKTP